MSATPAIKLNDVVFRFNEKGSRNILDHVSLEIEAGKMTVIMGSSGCGKSTLAAVAAGLYPENGGFLECGEIHLFGNDLKEMNPQQRSAYLSLMFQNPDLQFCMASLRKELFFCMENVCLDPSEMNDKAVSIAEALGITELLDQPLHQLSGGEKQKAALACLIAVGSKCLILDEAFANIDRTCAEEILSLLQELQSQGVTIVAIDHQLDLWQDAADEIIILSEGGKPLLGGISRDNLEQHRQVFLDEGLFYPGEPEHKAARTDDTEAAITFRRVSIPLVTGTTRFGRPVLGENLVEQADISFPKGRMTAVLGSSGCGKTTTFLSVLKKHPYLGTIEIFGQDLKKIPAADLYRKIGIVFQNPANQFISQKVEEEVTDSLKVWNRSMTEAECTSRTAELLEAYGLKRQRKYSPYMLSQGQQRRLAVLSVLAGGQQILLLDEPTYGQDYRSTRSIMEQLKRKVDEDGLTVIFITHDRKLAVKWADKILLLQEKHLEEYREEKQQ